MSVIFCRKCQGLIEQDQSFCPRCYTPTRKPPLLRRILEAITGWFGGFDGPGGGTIVPRPLSNTNITVHKRERLTFHDKNTGEVREFSSVDDAPPELRAMFEAAMGRGGSLDSNALAGDLPRMSGQTIMKRIATGPDGVQRTEITVRGKDGVERHYASVDELPPEMRRLLGEFQRLE